MSADLEAELRAAMAGEVRFDAYSRHLYSTDASMYAIEPIGVAFPRDADDVVAAVVTAGRFATPVLPRGAGTSLAGQTVGRAVVLDFSRFMHGLVAIDPEQRLATVQPGLVQDDLNRAAAAHGLLFAPDTSTSNRATLGGMIGNNSCGARSARHGMTIDHVASLDVVLSDGARANLGAVSDEELARRAHGGHLEATLYRDVAALVAGHGDTIRRDTPPYWRRNGGYRLERLLPERAPFNLANLVVGSEGTLSVVTGATVRLVPLPAAVVAVAGHFTSVAAAIDSVAIARECGAAAIELVDRFILDLARRSPQHATLTSVLHGDPGAFLWVEFTGDSPAEARALAGVLEKRWRAAGHGYATIRVEGPEQLGRFRELRKAGLGLLMAAGQGRERSVAFIEDTAVDPAHLGAYTGRIAALLERHGLRAGFYGHASAGCLHIRPFMDLERPGEVDRLRAVADEVFALVTEFGGNNSSEHGDGLARGEFNRRVLGDALYGLNREVKRIFDPAGRFSPGRKVDTPRLTEHLRDPALPRAIPLVTHFSFGDQGGMRAVANRCARIGACRKSGASGGVMCPSYMATRDEEHSTRGRANALVHALSSPDPGAALGTDRLHEVLDLCLECKACKSECPMSVDMASLKAEALAHRHARLGVPAGAWLFGHARALNRIGSMLAPVSNWVANWAPARALAERLVGIDRRRAFPTFHRESLQQWFARRQAAARRTPRRSGTPARGPVVFLADSFTSYTEPGIGRAAVELLELAGFEVDLVGDVCCGRSLISKGLLREARARHAALIARLAPAARAGVPIAGVEPSCVFTLRDELPALATTALADGARAVAAQATMVDDLLVRAIDDGALVMPSSGDSRRVLFHAHCHQKAAGATRGSVELLKRIPGLEVESLDAGCCGMAGSFGFEREHYDLSMRIGGMRLRPALERDPAPIVATGVSCRGQVEALVGRSAVHPIEAVWEVIGRAHGGAGR